MPIPLSRLGYFLDPTYHFKKLVFGAFIALAVSAWCFMQTEYFLTYTNYPRNEEIKNHMRLSRDLQNRQRQSAVQDPERVEMHEPIDTIYFSPTESKQVKDARESVVNDKELEKVLSDSFEVNLNNVSAVVIPAWAMKTRTTDSCRNAGIVCPAAWIELEKAKSEGDAGGTTIRDKAPNHIRTRDGIPRIFLMTKAFTSPPSSLKLAMGHELMHAMNIPGYRLTIKVPGFDEPVALTRWQTDLSYLAEYKGYVRKANLETLDQYAAGTLTVVFLGLFGINMFALLCRKRMRPIM